MSPRIGSLLAAALLWTTVALAQGSPVTLQRLTEALDAKTLSDKEIAEIVLEVGVSFKLTADIEKNFRRRGASDLVILAVRNGFRPPLPAGPATLDAISQALEKGASSADVAAHVEKDGVAGPFNAPHSSRLAAAGATPVLQRIVAGRWLQANPLDGSIEQLEALLAAGGGSEQIAAKLGGAPLSFDVGRETFSRLSSAGAAPALLQAIASSFLEGLQKPLTLDQIIIIQGAGVPSAALVKRIAEVGTDFEAAGDAADRMRTAGVDAAVSEAVLARRIAAAKEPLSLAALERGVRSGVAPSDVLEGIKRRGVDFTLTKQDAAALASLPKAVRVAAVIQSLGQQGYRAYRPPRASVVTAGDQGLFDVRLTIDHAEDVVVIEDVILVKSLRGAASIDEGSEVSQPLPVDIDPNTFAVEVKDGRGDVSVYWAPEKANGYICRARILDEKGGADRYHMRLTWRRGGANAGGVRRAAPTLRKN